MTQSAEDATLNDYCCSGMGGTDSCFYWKGQDVVERGKKLYTHLIQMAKYSYKITWGHWPSKERRYALRSVELSHYR